MFYATRDILEIALEEMSYKHNTTGKINSRRLLKMSDVLEGKQLNRTKGGYYDYVGLFNIHTTIQHPPFFRERVTLRTTE
jgi:hypothetical protein